MADLPTRDAFFENLHTHFQVIDGPEGGLDLELIHVSALQSTPRQQLFSILFRGASSGFLPQRTYTLQHARLGEMSLFLVPVAQEEGFFIYEAVFNHLVV
jgi:hypothetical protein